MKLKFAFGALVAAFLGLSVSAQAGVIVYTSEAAWNSAVSGIELEDFSGSPVGVLAAGTTDLGKLSVTIGSNPFGNQEIAGSGEINGSNEFVGFLRESENTLLSFGDFGSFTAFAGDWRSTTTGDELTMLIAGELINFTDYLSGSGDGFLGIVSDLAFDEIVFGVETLTTFGEYFQLDNVRFANAANNVDAPSGLALLGLGLIGLGLIARRKRVAA